MIESMFIELSIIIILAVVISGLLKLLKQPLIIGYIITGILAGPFFLNMVKTSDFVSTLSQLGVVFLLFIAGLSLNPKVMKSVGKVSLITGIGQIAFTTILGFFIAKMLGFPDIVSLYIAIALTFSSTIIIVKLLSDKGDMQSLYGRISLGFLIVQDIVAILILIVISSSANGFSTLNITLETALFAIGILAAIVIFSIFGLPRITKIVAKSQEFLLLFSIGWLFLLAIVFGYLNFSIEIGALIAGITLSVSPFHHEIKIKMNVLRDFFILFFFVILGSQMVFTNISAFILPVILFSIFILVGNPLIVMILMGTLKYTKRSGFMAGLTVAQISEFSLILIALGVKMGHIPNEILSMITAIGLMTIFGSTYTIMHANKIYSHISKYLVIFERKGKKLKDSSKNKVENCDIILFGYNRLGLSLTDSIKNLKKKFLIIDHDPEVINDLMEKGYDCKYGDANDMEFLDELGLSKTRMVISTIPDNETNMLLIRKVKKVNRNAIIIVVSHQIGEAMKLYERGATYIIMPYFLGGQHASALIEKHGLNLNNFTKEKTKQINHLKLREMLKHKHPRAEK
ncbi:MAG: cation:proton antiporter [Candidatus Aenigmarchaeota archaeon]|nr:cation:proton antiporter [Candidatus Aenigmarchaeota archaeon]